MPEEPRLTQRTLRLLSRPWLYGPALAFLGVLVTGLALKGAADITGKEYRVDQVLAQHRIRIFNEVAKLLDLAFGFSLGPVLAAAFFAVVLARTRSVERTATVALIVSLGCSSCWIMKALVERQSPGSVHQLISYPSGHTAFAAAVAAAWYWLAQGTEWSGLTLKAGFALAAAVALSRVYLGVHYPSDVLAACVLSIGSAVFAAGVAPHVFSLGIVKAAFRLSRGRFKQK